ncbi:MAG: AraC family transcriptional regulator [Rikenellaceae bacterium]|nr:AraC family transcriptional regulator [Rikenellaceae bacterium]
MKIIRSKDIPDSRKNESTFVVVKSLPGRFYISRTGEGKVLYNEDGQIRLNIERKGEIDIATGKMVFIPPSSDFTIFVSAASCFYLYRISVKHHFTESALPIQWLYETGEYPPTDEYCQIEAHQKVAMFFSALAGYIEDGLSAHQLYTHKAHELLLLLKNYHQRAELSRFFRPLIERDHEFSDFILANYRSYRTVQELSDASCHSLSAFNRLFRKNFGSAPYAWIKQQRANDIFYDLTVTNTPIKEISADHGFGSLSQFTTFCKRNFGQGPRQLRKMHSVCADAMPGHKHEL